jgi:hypothetical protein
MKNIDLSRRTRCPFYGFELGVNYLDCGDNRCALESGKFPCRMWAQDVYPDFDCCDYNTLNNKSVLNSIMDSLIAPKEFGGRVLRVSLWRDIIMNVDRNVFLRLNRKSHSSDFE